MVADSSSKPERISPAYRPRMTCCSASVAMCRLRSPWDTISKAKTAKDPISRIVKSIRFIKVPLLAGLVSPQVLPYIVSPRLFYNISGFRAGLCSCQHGCAGPEARERALLFCPYLPSLPCHRMSELEMGTTGCECATTIFNILLRLVCDVPAGQHDFGGCVWTTSFESFAPYATVYLALLPGKILSRLDRVPANSGSGTRFRTSQAQEDSPRIFVSWRPYTAHIHGGLAYCRLRL